MNFARTFTLLFTLALLGASVHADVLVVRADGAGDFNSLVDAVAAAQDGDILLVQSDFAHEVVSIDGKSLTVIGEGSERRMLGVLSILGLDATQSVTVRGLQIGPNPFSFFAGASLAVSGSDGAVLIEDCHVQGLGGLDDSNPHGKRGMLVVDAPGVLLTRSTVVGGAGVSANDDPFPLGFFTAGNGGPAVHIENGALNAYESLIVGGNGGSDIFDMQPGGNGGAAISGTAARVWFEGGVATGGSGGGGCISAHDGCAGGPGIALDFTDPLVLRASHVSGGSGGPLTPLDEFEGASGNIGIDLAGQVANLPGGASSTHELSPVRSGEAGSLTVFGPEGATAAWFFSVGLNAQKLGGSKGVLAVDFPILGPYLLGTLPASGQLSFDFTVPSLAGTGLEGFTLPKQAIVVDGDGLRFSGPTAFVHVGTSPAP